MINRTCALAGCSYEWGVHVALLARAAGLTDEQLSALATGISGAAFWNDAEAALIGTAEALDKRATLNDAEWRALRSHYDEPQAIEVIMLCGFYRTVAYLANGLALSPEPWSAPLQA